MTKAGPVNADRYWERITYFLERVIPVANEHKIRMACHPHDPGVPPGEGFQGIDAVLGTVDGLKKFVSIKESPYHGLNFCQGTVSEMLQDPGKEILDVIRYFGSRKKIFNVHFRNIRGKRDDFQEVLSGRRRYRLRESHDGLQGSRISLHDDARSRARSIPTIPAVYRRSHLRTVTFAR